MTRKILLADDSVTIRKVVELTFSDEDVQITAVADGALALERARADRPDIVIADTVMPGLDGFKLCERMKSDASLRTVPFLLLHGTFDAFDEERARACGAEGSIAKPFESQEMIRKVNEVVVAAPPPALQLPVQPPAPPRSAAPAPARIVAPPAPPPPAPVPPPALAMAPAAPASAAPAVPARPAPPPPPPRPAAPAPLRFPVVAPPPAPPATPPPLPAAPPPAALRAPAAMPPPPPPPARSVEMPAAPLSPFADEDFDLGPVPAEPAAAPGADDDLWSEVNLRGSSAPIIDPAVGEDNLWGSLADTSVLDERDSPLPSRRVEAPAVAPPPPAPAPHAVPAAVVAPPPAAAIDSVELERLVAARVETAVRQALDRLVAGSARAAIEDVAWQVVPELAEAMIKAEIERVARATDTG